MVLITDAPVGIDELLAVVDGAEVELGAEARATVGASRDLVDATLAGGEPVYGVNTGVGHMRDVRVPDDELSAWQYFLVTTHAGGIGPPLPTSVVRAALAARLVGIARGGSGASPAVADVLAAMLNAGVHPVVPETGSVGAADIGQMASIALVAIGRGAAELDGEVMPGGEALGRAGIAPLGLRPKDGLALISANAVAIGHGALVVGRAARAADFADLAAALSMEATGANPSVVTPPVGRAKPFPGQIEACRHLTALLAGSDLLGAKPRSVQDPLSFRVVPQVHGAQRELVDLARNAVETELNSRSDNPLVAVEEGLIVHNGNFQPVVLAIAFDALRIALAHVGQLSDRRMSHLWSAFFAAVEGAGPADVGAGEPGLFGLSLRPPAAAVVAELKQLAAPATLDVAPLDMGVEDHATGAPLSVRKTDEALDHLDDVLAVEVLLARDVLSVTHGGGRLGTETAAALARVGDAVAASTDRAPAGVHRAVRTVLNGDPAHGRGR